jgi:phage terminase large subunit-like protein
MTSLSKKPIRSRCLPMVLDPRIQELLDNLELAAQHKATHAKEFFVPYPKQQEFFDQGAIFRERCFSAGNQLGKSEAGAFELTCHLTGEYPKDWMGRTFDRPTEWWAGGITGKLTRDVIQNKLCGKPGIESAFGTGMIPLDKFNGKPSMARGVTDLYDTISVKHKSGGLSSLGLKSYEEGRTKWQGTTLDGVWFDEEPPEEIYGEGLQRLKEGGCAYMTFTPLQGATTIVTKFFDNPSKDQGLVIMTIDDITHWSEEYKKQRIESTPPHLQRSRFYGLPAQGEGAVFPIMRDQISEDTIPLHDIPPHWVFIWGIDFGIAHPFAAVLMAWDRDADVVHVVHTIKMPDAMLLQHAAAMKPFGVIPVAWPHDNIRDRGDLQPIAKKYKDLGLKMLPRHARFDNGSNSFEAGVSEILLRLQTGRLKVARHLNDWLLEFERYHRKDGLVVKVNDDLMSGTRMGIMELRHAQPRMLGVQMLRQPNSGKVNMAIGHDDDPWRVDSNA